MMHGSLSKSNAFFLAALTAVGILILLSTPLQVKAAEAKTRQGNQEPRKQQQQQRSHSPRPNFVVVLADDLDWTLGGANASTLSKTRRLIGGERHNGNGGKSGLGGGKTFSNWFVQTPVCCASRAELFTGRVYHNLKVPAVSFKGCMHIDVQDDQDHIFWNKWYFSNFFTDAKHTHPNNNLNYKVGIFGKHLNTHNPSDFTPNGVDEMLINGGGEYLNPTFRHIWWARKKRNMIDNNKNSDNSNVNVNEEDYELKYDLEKSFNNCTESTGMPCYSTSVIGNASLAWIRKQILPDDGDDFDGDGDGHKSKRKSENDRPPFFALISVKAPHIQDGGGFPMAIPAPWYENTTIPERFAPRTSNYNATTTRPNEKDYHHWLVRNQPPMSDLEATMVDDLYVSRLKTLLSIDDLVEDLVEELETLGVLNNTYIVFTSDNGYRLGQFRMPQCKLHPYENDVRVPMMIRGPGIGTGATIAPAPAVTATTNNGNNNNNTKHKDTNTTPSTTGHSVAAAAVFSHVHLMPTLLGLATGMHDSQDILPETMDGTNLARLLLDADVDVDANIDGDSDVNVGSRDQNEDEDQTSYGTNTSNTSTLVFSSKSVLPSSSSSPSPSSSISLLIEYTSLGNVVRYQHLIDTYNHSFVALRIMPRDHPITPTHDNGTRILSNTTLPERTAIRRGTGTGTVSNVMIETISNLKYIEFRDSRVDWTNTETPPLERELYDLDQDPYELDNLLFGDGATAIATASIGSPPIPSPPVPPFTRITPSLLRALEAKTRRLIRCSGDDCRREHSTGLHFDDEHDFGGGAPNEEIVG
jgi:arylsulfatase A-like enzyme